MELEARMLLDSGHRAEAEAQLREALTISRDAGAQFCGSKVAGALSRAVEDPAERAEFLAEGKAMLERGAVGHNHLWFYRDAIEAQLAAGDAPGALAYAAALEDYTRAEPLPWADLFVERGRALAAALGGLDKAVAVRLRDVGAALKHAGMTPFLPRVEAALRA